MGLGHHEADLSEIGLLAFEGQMPRATSPTGSGSSTGTAPIPSSRRRRWRRRSCSSGMPRSGTTALSHLLAADPDNRSLLAWEANESIPPPTTATYQTDPRFERARDTPSAVDLINPGFKAIHHDEPDDAMECTVLHAQHFQSLIYSTCSTSRLRRVDARLHVGRRDALPPAGAAGAAVGVPRALAAQVAAVRAAARRAVRDLSRRAPGRHPP